MTAGLPSTALPAIRRAGPDGGVCILERFPNLFLAGAPKCGTTSLADWLGQHPDVFVPIVKEPVYFGADLTRPVGWKRTKADYLRLFEAWGDEAYALDATTANFHSQAAAGEIAAAAPDAKIVIALRNPIEAAHSYYREHVYNGVEVVGSFEEALAAQDDRRADPSPRKVGVRESRIYSRVYAIRPNVGRYVDHFGRERVRIVLMDDLRRDPERTFAELCDWLGLDRAAAARVTFATRNAAKRPRWARLGVIANSPPAWAGRLAAPFMSKARRQRLRAALHRFNAVPSKNPPIRPETPARLVEVFRDDVPWLSELLDRDLSHWLRVDG